MAEKLPEGITAYMEYRGQLFRLKRIRSYNGIIQPILATFLQASLRRNREFCAEITNTSHLYSLGSPVYLATNKNLAGATVTDIIDSVEPVDSGCWALRQDSVTCQDESNEQTTDNSPAALWCG
jgi:hypothetical protein